MLPFLALLGVASASTRHPCTQAEDLGPGRYARKSMVVFDVQVDDDAIVAPAIAGSDPMGGKLADGEQLIHSVARGLFAVDYPLERFDAWHSGTSPVLDGETLVVSAQAQALSCADAAVVPRIAEAQVERGEEPGAYKYKLKLELDVYQRQDGVLTLTDHIRAVAPSPLDRVEDAMSGARQAAVSQVKDAVPVSAKDLKRAKAVKEVVVNNLPADQAAQVEAVVEQAQLAATRVASVARPATLIPMIETGAHPGELGFGWRAVENRCYIEAPEAEDRDYDWRMLECLVLNRTRQAVRAVQLDTRKVQEFRLFGPVAQSKGRNANMPLGTEEGLRVGDGYWLQHEGRRVGYARVKRLGVGGRDGAVMPTRMQVVYGRKGNSEGANGLEHPQLGIEVGAQGSAVPAVHPVATLPADPISGASRQLIGAGHIPAGVLRFDVNLGRMTRMFEWYQTNRLGVSMVGELGSFNAAFGVERRFLIAPRIYGYGGAAANFTGWSVPSGFAYTDDDGEQQEVSAGASTIGPEGDAGLIVMIHPNVLIRLTGGARYGAPVAEFNWSHDETEGVVVPVTLDGSTFALRSTGGFAGLSTAWVF